MTEETGRPQALPGAEGDTLESPDTAVRRGAEAPVARDAAPARVGPYRLESLLGRGGMGEVWAAWDERLERRVALKRVAPARRGVAEVRARFWREARALAGLDHPGLVAVHDLGEAPDGTLYMAMELVEGRPLEELLDTPWAPEDTRRVLLAVAEALGAAHAAGITHRDVKPANLLVEPSGRARVVDFGLARRPEAEEERVTADGVIVGTPAWMAPEQVLGAPIGPATDVFALGLVAYRLLTGTHPYARETAAATLAALTGTARRPLADAAPHLPPAWVATFERCLAMRPEDRWPDATALAAALEALPSAVGAVPPAPSPAPPLAALDSDLRAAWPAPPPDSRPRRIRRWALPAAATVAAAGLAAILAWSPAPPAAPGALVDAQVAPSPAPTLPPEPLADLPPRPVVSVLGFMTHGPPAEATRAAVLADALRTWLSLDPMHVVASPAAVLDETLPPGTLPTAPESLAHLTRPGRALGHVDVAAVGTLHPIPGGREADLELRLVAPATGERLLTRTFRGDPTRPAAFARAVAAELMPLLGARLPDTAPAMTRSPEAWEALLESRHARRTDDHAAAGAAIERALRLDPAFLPARLERLEHLRIRQDRADLASEAAALEAEAAAMSPRDRTLLAAWRAVGELRPRDAVAALTELLDAWPHDVEAMELLLVLRMGEPEVADLREVEALAQRLLALAPRHEGAASRLIRALMTRGRIADARGLLEALEVPMTGADRAELPGELALYAGRWDEALAAFGLATSRSAEQPYAEHMAIATRLLAGRADEAAVAALARISEAESSGRGAYLDWTYSLAVQALIAMADDAPNGWQAARDTLIRWAERRASGREQAAFFGPRIALASGRPAAEVAAEVTAALAAPDLTDRARLELLALLALSETDPAALRAAAAPARAASVDLARSPLDRDVFHVLERALEARAALLERPADPAARAALDAAVPPVDWPRSEGHLSVRTDLLAVRADTLARAGFAAEARDAWTTVARLGYPRLWRTDLWVTARRHTQAPKEP